MKMGKAPKKAVEAVTIEKLVQGGLGMGRLAEGKVVFVPFVLPGETALVAPRVQKKSHVEADLLDVLEKARERVTPRCPLFGACGGCRLQHIPYSTQLRLKQDMFTEHFLRHRILTEEVLADAWDSITPSPREYHYRTRIRLQVDDDGAVGFHMSGTHRVVPAGSCPIAREELDAFLKAVQSPPFSRLSALSREVEMLLGPSEGKLIILLHYKRKPRPSDEAAAREITESHPMVKSFFFQPPEGALAGPFSASAKKDSDSGNDGFASFSLPERILGRSLELTYEPGGFCQVNQEQNENLIAKMLEWTNPRGNEKVLDLFCGLGNFSLPLAAKAGFVVGTDQQRSAIRSALRNMRLGGFVNCEFMRRTATDAIRDFIGAGRRFDLIVLDPPRQGCADIIPHIPRLRCANILYISCDGATLGRDLAIFGNHGFKVVRIGLLDMFPQTHHVECLALLKKA